MSDFLPQPNLDDIALGDILGALANPLRRRVVVELYLSPPRTERQCVAFGLPVSKATRTHHFRALRDKGLTSMRDLGNESPTMLRADEIERRFPGLLESIARAELDAQGIAWKPKQRAQMLARYRDAA